MYGSFEGMMPKGDAAHPAFEMNMRNKSTNTPPASLLSSLSALHSSTSSLLLLLLGPVDVEFKGVDKS